MIRALNTIDEVPLRVAADARAAVAAHVEQRVNTARLVARDDDALGRERTCEVVAGVRNLVGAARANPAIEIETLELQPIELGIRVEAARQRRMHRVRKRGTF